MSIRQRFARIFLKGYESLSQDRWRYDAVDERNYRSGGVQFTTTGAMEAFCRAAFGRSTDKVEGRAGNHRFVGGVEEVVSQLAELPATARRSVTLEATREERQLRVHFNNHDPENSAVEISGIPHHESSEIRWAVDSHTTPLTWNQRRRGVPVLLPMTAKEEFQEGLKSALARRSAVWGALAGLGTSIAVILLQSATGWLQ